MLLMPKNNTHTVNNDTLFIAVLNNTENSITQTLKLFIHTYIGSVQFSLEKVSPVVQGHILQSLNSFRGVFIRQVTFIGLPDVMDNVAIRQLKEKYTPHN